MPTAVRPASQTSAKRRPQSRRSQLATIIAIKNTTASSGRHCSSYGKVPKKMNRSFSWTNAQQAPAPRHARLFGAAQTASTNAQRTSGGIVTVRNATARTVRVLLKTLLNRLARNQPKRPEVAGGGGSSATGSSCVRSVTGHPPLRQEPLSALQGGEGGAQPEGPGG